MGKEVNASDRSIVIQAITSGSQCIATSHNTAFEGCCTSDLMLFQAVCGTESSVAAVDVKQAVCRMGGARSLRNNVVDNLKDKLLF